ncbi:MAG: zinc dependent phospholipase C family protein [Deltaproteobacteria bacterium]|nr:zinc dependent phospholipase C family protein [Deltaproteobacteria bacterium]MBN2673151.1 zinc dependent phospholipase C family protein [Deltaproteobacteria bacterium]
MADTLLHITLANRIAQHSRLPDTLKRIITMFPDDFAMGSVLFDLPFYNHLLRTGIETLRHKPLTYHPFGQAVHEIDGRTLCIQLLHRAENDAEHTLALGALTHFAVDLVFHKEIEHRIQGSTISHDELERQIGLHCHYDLLGHSGVGTPYARDITFLFPSSHWSKFVSSAFRSLFTATPAPDQFTQWQRSFRVFGFLYSKPYFPWLRTLAPDDPQLAQRSLELMHDSIELGASFLTFAYDVVQQKISLEDLTAALPPKRMSDGSDMK